MKCDSPLKIVNPYTNKPITVGCRQCDSCRIASANAKTLLLMNELKKASFPLFVTLTYDNEHLPVVFNGGDKVLRLSAPGVFDVIGDLPERVYIEPKRPYNYPYKNATGVIWYRDIQLFIKRLRINLYRNGKGNFRFFACCEYGTVRKRPHAHLLFFFSKLSDLRGIEQLICKSWRMCDKTRLLAGIKFADVAVGSYLAAYINSNNDSYSLAKHKFFKQKTYRSKSLDYGCTKADQEEVKRVIENRLYKSFDFCSDTRPFEYFDCSRKGSLSSCFVSERVFRTYFRRPYQYSTISAKCFRIRARIIYKLYYGTFYGELRQQDSNFIRGYRSWLKLMSYENSYELFCFYVDLFLSMESLYYSQLNRRYMLSYEVKSKNDYFLDAWNTRMVNLGSKGYYAKLLTQFEVKYVDDMSILTRHELKGYKFRYRKRLLPKHQNSIYYSFL